MHLFDLSNYCFNPYAIPPFISTLMVMGLMAFIIKVEGVSRVSLSFVVMAMTFIFLFFSDTLIFSSANSETAMRWLKVGYIGICLLPAACQQCAYAILGISRQYKKTITIIWLISFILLLLSQISPQFISGVQRYWWGYYGLYGWIGGLFVLFTFSTFAFCAFHFIREYRFAPSHSLQQARAKACTLAFGLGYIGSVDFIAKFGFNFYPFGFIPLLTLLFVLAWVALRYRLTITPSFASKNIIDTMVDALVVLAEDGTVALTNHKAVMLLGKDEDKLVTQYFFDLTGWDLFNKNSQDLARLCPVKDMPVLLTRVNGAVIDLLLSVSVMEDGKRIQAFVCLFRDVTEKKIVAEQLQQSHDLLEERVAKRTRKLEEANKELHREVTERNRIEKERAELIIKSFTQSKLASLGEIATGVAHEINQPLSYIKIIFESTLRDIQENNLDSEELRDDCRESLRQIGRITSIINHLRIFGRNDDISFDNYANLREVLNNTFILMGERLRLKNIKYSVDIPPEIPEIRGSSVRIEQVFINLLQNAADALEGVEMPEIRIKISKLEEALTIAFSDNGVGVSPAIREKIFNPFFTSKEVGKGTGLGLSVSFGIIQEHHGRIELDTVNSGWTTFVITLPLGEAGMDKERMSP